MNCFYRMREDLWDSEEKQLLACVFSTNFFFFLQIGHKEKNVFIINNPARLFFVPVFLNRIDFHTAEKVIRKSFLWQFSKFYIDKSLNNLTQQRFDRFCFLLHRFLRQSGLRRRLLGQIDRWYREIFGWFRWSRGQKQEKRLSQRWTQFGKLDPLQFELSCVRETRPENLI